MLLKRILRRLLRLFRKETVHLYEVRSSGGICIPFNNLESADRSFLWRAIVDKKDTITLYKDGQPLKSTSPNPHS